MSQGDGNRVGGMILDAIDQLRKRKARPDLDRICHMMERRHGLKPQQVNQELSKLVQEGVVIKVDYKGNTSYRNAAKWIKTKQQFYGSFYSVDIHAAVLEAVRVLTHTPPNQAQRSASLLAIEQYLLKRDSQSNLNQATLRSILEKEVEKRHLHQLANGEYIPVNLFPPQASSPECSPNKTPPHAKRFKSDGESPEDSSHSGDEQNRCDYCLFPSNTNRKGEHEDLLTCKDCGAKAHPSCMEYTKLLYEKFPNPHEWQCPDCKICVVCDETNMANDLLTCYICFKGYHMQCHDPAITNKPTGTWLCCDCDTSVDKDKMPKNKTKYISVNSADNQKRSVSPSFKEGFQKSIEGYPTSIPLAMKWSIENVEEFFRVIGFEDEAFAFREQEIDGLSLLLLKRNDVLTGLGIKLGPALKIYKHVLNLQQRISEN